MVQLIKNKPEEKERVDRKECVRDDHQVNLMHPCIHNHNVVFKK